MSTPGGGREKGSANRRCDKKIGKKKESGEFLYSGVMWPFPVTVIYEGQKCYNIPAANQKNGSKILCACVCGGLKWEQLIEAETRRKYTSIQ